ncbi:hypothetical protein [Pontibacter sp. 172403-2]|uniref:hypothetical protein n=1 Tax=Pontibacter rufus TaxID=2791028 RepID=UPI001E40B0CA|nr:hypothetical protein [Pontibacter sp. 172403-2]
MKIILPFLLVILISFTAYSQGFEGKIVYKTAYKSKAPGMTDEELVAMLGTTQEYFYKAGSY